MSVQAAHQFIAEARRGGGLGDRIAALGPEADLEALVRLAAEAGFELTAVELREAYRQDWALRRIALSAGAASARPRHSAGATAR